MVYSRTDCALKADFGDKAKSQHLSTRSNKKPAHGTASVTFSHSSCSDEGEMHEWWHYMGYGPLPSLKCTGKEFSTCLRSIQTVSKEITVDPWTGFFIQAEWYLVMSNKQSLCYHLAKWSNHLIWYIQGNGSIMDLSGSYRGHRQVA